MLRKKPPVVVEYVSGQLHVDFIVVHNASTEVVRRGSILQLAPGQNQEGYGNKITTDNMLQFKGTGKKHRVYCTCWSNSGSLWITKGGKRLYLGSLFTSDLKDEFYTKREVADGGHL